jgi:hypothetical protein
MSSVSSRLLRPRENRTGRGEVAGMGFGAGPPEKRKIQVKNMVSVVILVSYSGSNFNFRSLFWRQPTPPLGGDVGVYYGSGRRCLSQTGGVTSAGGGVGKYLSR